MENKQIEIETVLKDAWMLFKKNWTFFFWSSIFMALIVIGVIFFSVVTFGAGKFFELPDSLMLVLFVVATLAVMYFAALFRIGYFGELLQVNRGEAASWKRLWSHKKLVLPYAAALFISVIAVMFGFVLFIIPGIILSIAFSMFLLILLDENVTAVEALKRSMAITKGHRWMLLVAFLVVALIGFVIGFCLGVVLGLIGNDILTELALRVLNMLFSIYGYMVSVVIYDKYLKAPTAEVAAA